MDLAEKRASSALEEEPDVIAGEVKDGKIRGRNIQQFKYHIETELSITIAFLMGLEHQLPAMSTLWVHGGWSKRDRREY